MEEVPISVQDVADSLVVIKKFGTRQMPSEVPKALNFSEPLEPSRELEPLESFLELEERRSEQMPRPSATRAANSDSTGVAGGSSASEWDHGLGAVNSGSTVPDLSPCSEHSASGPSGASGSPLETSRSRGKAVDH